LETAPPIQARAHRTNAWSGFRLAGLSIADIAGAMVFGALTPAIRGRITTPWLLAAFLTRADPVRST
jgi:hypothetical protein